MPHPPTICQFWGTHSALPPPQCRKDGAMRIHWILTRGLHAAVFKQTGFVPTVHARPIDSLLHQGRVHQRAISERKIPHHAYSGHAVSERVGQVRDHQTQLAHRV